MTERFSDEGRSHFLNPLGGDEDAPEGHMPGCIGSVKMDETSSNGKGRS